MTTVTQDVVLFLKQPHWEIYKRRNIFSKCMNMALNRFCIDEELANESSGVFYLDSSKGKENI